MSPSENDLRAALRDGEDDGRPDVDGLLAHVRGRRAQRRTRVLSAAAAVVVVAAAAVGGAALWGGSDDRPGVTSQRSHVRTGPLIVPSGDPTDVAPSAGCPAESPHLLDPPGRVPRTAPEQRMFAAPVRTVTVCAYTEVGSTPAATVSTTFTGTDATTLTRSIETASPTALRIPCPDIASQQRTQLAIIGVTAGGTQLPVVTTDVSIPNCNQPITNGTAVRFAWKPPTVLAGRIAALASRGRAVPGTVAPTSGPPPVSPSNRKIGTPVH